MDTIPDPGSWPLAVYGLMVMGLTVVMIAFSYILGERHRERTTDDPYESGVMSSGPIGPRIDVSYYMVAVFFVIFDLEAVFLFAWAVSAKELGWVGYLEVVVFIAVLLAGLAYLWLIGALESSSFRQRAEKAAVE